MYYRLCILHFLITSIQTIKINLVIVQLSIRRASSAGDNPATWTRRAETSWEGISDKTKAKPH